MPLDLYNKESLDRMESLQPVQVPETNAFDGFVRGAGMYAMRGFAQTARAIDMAGAVGPIVQDAFTGGTEAQDKYFKEHDEVFGSAVDAWTPKPNEVGTAGQVVGSLLSMLPTVMLSPSLVVGSQELSTAEELAQKGIEPSKAIAVGAIQATGTGLGIWMPILGKNLWQRVFLGGAGFNVAQGVAMRGASQAVLSGTPAEGEYKAFDPQSMTLDALLGAAFGTLAHVSPSQRAQGEEVWKRIEDWAQRLNPSDVDAVAALRQAQHMNVDSIPGTPKGPEDIEAHVQRMKASIDQLAKDQPVEVGDLPEPKVEADPVRNEENVDRLKTLRNEAQKVAAEEGIQPQERRTNLELRKKVSEMSPEEMKSALLTDELTGLGNRRAYNEAPAPNVHVMADVEGLKWINDNMGETAGDSMLQAVGQAIREETPRGFRRGGDEFAIHADTDAEAKAIQNAVQKRLSEATITATLPGGTTITKKGIGIHYGQGATFEAADAALRAEKARKEIAGERTARGTEPQGLVREPAKGLEAERQATTEVKDPLQSAADRFVSENPDVLLTVGQNADGTPITKSAKAYLEEARAEVQKATDDTSLFRMAAECLLGGS